MTRPKISDAGMAVLRYLRAEEQAGRAPSYRAVTTATGHTQAVFGPLRQHKLVEPRGLKLTDFGRGVADGLVTTKVQNHGPKPMPAPPVVEKPAPVVEVPEALAGYRLPEGMKHPPIPGPATRPQGMSVRQWAAITVPEHSPLHNACARGMW